MKSMYLLGAGLAVLTACGPSVEGPDEHDTDALASICAAPNPSASDYAWYEATLACLQDASVPTTERRQARDRFMAHVRGSGGFPIVDGGTVVFVYVNDPAFDVDDDKATAEDFAYGRRRLPIRVAGDFNGWNPEAQWMYEAPLDFFHVPAYLFPQGGERWRYKLVSRNDQGQNVWFSDPQSRRFDYDANGRISLVQGGRFEGHLELLPQVHATQLNVDRDVYVYLPPGYETSSARYPVLYMQDGNNLFSVYQPWSAPESWEVDEVLQTEWDAGRIGGAVVIGIPNNANRMGEYTHVVDDIGFGPIGGEGDAYADFLVSDLKPLVDAAYRTHPGREATGVMGSSLGGLISFHIGRRNPETFRFVGGMSSTFDWGRFGLTQPTMLEVYQTANALDADDQVFYLDSGGQAPGGGCTGAPGESSDNYCSTEAMKDILIQQGIDTFPVNPNAGVLSPANIDIMHWWSPGAAHRESAWQARVHRPLRLFLGPWR